MNVLEDQLLKYNAGEGGDGAEFIRALRQNQVFVYLADAPVMEGDTVAKIRVHIGLEQNKAVAFAFSSLQILEAWCQSRSLQPHSVQLFGDDLCTTIKDGTGIVIDSGTSSALRIVADTVAAIRAGELVTHPQLVKCGVSTAVVTVDPNAESDRQVQQYEPMVRSGVMVPTKEEAPDTNAPPSKNFARRSKPTQFFAVPQGAKARPQPTVDPTRQRTYTSSNLKKVVRPPGSGEDEGQK